MIDLTNKNQDELNALVQKFEHVLESVKPSDKQNYAYIINAGVNHIVDKYADLNNSWKSWTMVVLKKLINKINTDSDIIEIIDNFIKYYNDEFTNYSEEMSIYDRVDIEHGFVINFCDKNL